MTAGARVRGATASVIAAALCLPAAAGVGILVSRASAASDENSARRGALHAAARITQEILSYDYRTIDKDLARARADTTGVFAKQYDAAAAGLRAEARRTQAIVQARVRDTAVVSAGGDRVDVLVFADQVSIARPSTTAAPATRLIPSAVQLTLVRAGGRWKVSDLTAVQTSAGTGSAPG